MIHTQNITKTDLPGVMALWTALHEQTVENNCWPPVPDDRWFAHLCRHCSWAVAKDDGKIVGFAFWKLGPKGNAFVRAIGAMEEIPYLHLVLACVRASKEYAYGLLHRNRPEHAWYSKIGATFEPEGYPPLTPRQEAAYATREEKLAARVPVSEKVIVPVSLLTLVQARLEELS